MTTDKKVTESLFELFCNLMENKIFLITEFNLKDASILCNCSSLVLEQTINKKLGFSFTQIISLYRVGYARKLLSIGVSYAFVYKYSGFNSVKELEKAMECIVN
ncbi:MAG: hypothetical protein WCR71_04260 [Bacteroidales bacterium]